MPLALGWEGARNKAGLQDSAAYFYTSENRDSTQISAVLRFLFFVLTIEFSVGLLRRASAAF